MKRAVAAFLAVAMVMILCCSCGESQDAEETGRYVEEIIELPEGGSNYVGLVQGVDSVCLAQREGKDLVSVDGGRTFAESGKEVPATLKKWLNQGMAAVPDGSRMFTGFDESSMIRNYILMTGEEKEIALMEPAKSGLGSYHMEAYYGAGYFYGCFGRSMVTSIYRIDASTGEMEFLLDVTGEMRYAAADEKLLYIVMENGLLLYDLQERRQILEEDEILEAFVAQGVAYCYPGYTFMLYPYGEGVYILSHAGLYWHELYGEEMVQVIDGRQCGIGIPERDFVGMTVLEGEEKPVFLIAYTDGTLARFTFDATLPAVSEALRVYSVYEDGNILQAVNAFRQEFPDIPINYEIGMESGYGATADDILKRLATEIAAADAFRSENELYVIPLTFAVPVLAGKVENIKGVETLAQSSMGAWITDGTLNRENVTEFLTQAKRINDAVVEEAAAYVVPHNPDFSYWNGAYPLEKYLCPDAGAAVWDRTGIYAAGCEQDDRTRRGLQDIPCLRVL